MKYVIAMVLTCLCITACTTPSTPTPPPSPAPPVTCGPITTDVANALAGAFAQLDGCTNTAAITQSILSVLPSSICAAMQTQVAYKEARTRKLKVPLHEKGIVGNLVCPLAIQSVMGLLNGNVAPAEWSCSGNTDISAGLSAACELLPF